MKQDDFGKTKCRFVNRNYNNNRRKNNVNKSACLVLFCVFLTWQRDARQVRSSFCFSLQIRFGSDFDASSCHCCCCSRLDEPWWALMISKNADLQVQRLAKSPLEFAWLKCSRIRNYHPSIIGFSYVIIIRLACPAKQRVNSINRIRSPETTINPCVCTFD